MSLSLLKFMACVEHQGTTVSYTLTVPRKDWRPKPITWEVPARVPEYLATVPGLERRKLSGRPSVLVIGKVEGRQVILSCAWKTAAGDVEVTATGKISSSFEQVLADLRATFNAPPPVLDLEDIKEAIAELSVVTPFVDIPAANAASGKVVARDAREPRVSG